MILPLLALSPPPADGQAPPNSGMQTLIMMVLLMVVFWVVLIRPQRKRQKEHEARLAALQTGDQVVTSGGIHGLITNVRERTVTLKIAENVRIDLDKAAVATIVSKKDAPAEAAAPEEKQEEKKSS